MLLSRLIDPKRIRLRLFSRFSRRREAALDGSYVLVFPRENVFKTHLGELGRVDALTFQNSTSLRR